MAQRRGTSYALFILAGVICLSLVVFLPPYRTSFVGDDYIQLGFIKSFVANPAGALQLFLPYWSTWYYRPVQNIWFLANRLLFGLNPFGYYFLQACWHALTIALVYRLTRKLGVSIFAALCGTALFAIHAQHHDVVAWISSIAIIQAAALSLLATICYLTYLADPGRVRWLILTLLLCLFTLTVHEEGLLLPIFLAFVRLSQPRPGRWRLHRAEWWALAVLLPALAAYLFVQFSRPNLTIDVAATPAGHYLDYLRPGNVSHFLVTQFGRWTLLSNSGFGRGLLANLAALPLAEILFSAALLLLLAIWFRDGGRVVRLGLLWAGLHLGFLYFALYAQKPELFAGRHVYSAWIGICLALAAGIEQLVRQPWLAQRGRKWLPAGVVALVVLFLGLHIQQIRWVQQAWLQNTLEDRRAEAQLKALLPALTEETRVFANRFVLTPSFLPATLAVWYGLPEVHGGPLAALKAYEEVTEQFYLLDYADGLLYNLLPELQESPRAILLWRVRPQAIAVGADGRTSPLAAEAYALDVVAGPAGAPRLAQQVEPPAEGWAGLGYAAAIPAGAALRMGVWGEPGQMVRVRGVLPAGRIVTLYEGTLNDAGRWLPIDIPLDAYQGQKLSFWLEAAANPAGEAVYWANPRLAIDLQ